MLLPAALHDGPPAATGRRRQEPGRRQGSITRAPACRLSRRPSCPSPLPFTPPTKSAAAAVPCHQVPVPPGCFPPADGDSTTVGAASGAGAARGLHAVRYRGGARTDRSACHTFAGFLHLELLRGPIQRERAAGGGGRHVRAAVLATACQRTTAAQQASQATGQLASAPLSQPLALRHNFSTPWQGREGARTGGLPLSQHRCAMIV